MAANQELKKKLPMLFKLKLFYMAKKYGDKANGKGSTVYFGKGMHIDVSQSLFDCPICTCENDVSEKLFKSKYPVFNIKCTGCKRKLEVFSDMGGRLTVKEIISK